MSNTPHEPDPEHLPPVDAVIRDAREGSWQLPETPPDQQQATPANQSDGPTAARPQDHPRSTSGGAPAAPAQPSPAKAAAPVTAAKPAPAPSAPAAAHNAPPAHAPAGDAHGGAHAPAAHAPAAHAPAGAAHGGAHAPAAAGGHGHDAGHAEERLGPIDVQMWGAGIIATVVGLAIAVCFVVATSGVTAY